MYGTRYTYSSKDLSGQTDAYIYGNDVSWDGTNYTLVDTIESSTWSTDRTNLATRYHYTCFSTSGTCANVYYIHYFGDEYKPYYLTLTGGKDIEEMFTNTTNSTIKTNIDNWYSANMTGYTTKLEDTVWCNDREFSSGSLKGKDTAAGTGYSYFNAYGRNVSSKIPSLACSTTRDSFTVDGTIGNGKLTYPVGLLTADELTLAGSGSSPAYSTSSYLSAVRYWWSLSPYCFDDFSAFSFYLASSGILNNYYVFNSYGVRPSVSLRPGTRVSGGTGATGDPYIVE